MSDVPKSAPLYMRRHWERCILDLFDSANRKVVVNWLSESRNQKRVVVVGSGFTRNAVNGKGVPTWDDQRKELLKPKILGTSIKDAGIDTLELFDLFEKRRGKKALRQLLLNQLDDTSISPGPAHDALWASNPAAVVTTNYLDTVLEKSRPQRARAIFENYHLRCPHGDESLIPLVYFHGHRSAPETWVAGRTQYEELPKKKDASSRQGETTPRRTS